MRNPTRRLRARRRQRGAGLVLIIGVVATLAVSAATLVAFTANIQHNTLDTRQHVKSFVVTEAGLDSGMAMLGRRWPVSSTSIPTFDTAGFRDRFTPDEFADPQTGDFIYVDWYDDASPVDTGVRWDANDNGVLWMVSQANVGERSTRVVSLVELTWFTMSLPRGIPLWAAGDLLSNGQGNNPKILVEVPPPAGTVTTIQVGGDIEESSVSQPGIAQVTGDDISPIEEVFPQSLVDALTELAQQNGRYFTSLAAANASAADDVWSPTGGISGLTVIAPPAPTRMKITGNDTVNSEENPGILLILGGSEFEWGGNAEFYGVMYSEGPMSTSHGTADIHGMVITNNDEEMKGTPHILYNDNCIANLDQRFPSVARRVQNSWREVQPD